MQVLDQPQSTGWELTMQQLVQSASAQLYQACWPRAPQTHRCKRLTGLAGWPRNASMPPSRLIPRVLLVQYSVLQQLLWLAESTAEALIHGLGLLVLSLERWCRSSCGMSATTSQACWLQSRCKSALCSLLPSALRHRGSLRLRAPKAQLLSGTLPSMPLWTRGLAGSLLMPGQRLLQK